MADNDPWLASRYAGAKARTPEQQQYKVRDTAKLAPMAPPTKRSQRTEDRNLARAIKRSRRKPSRRPAWLSRWLRYSFAFILGAALSAGTILISQIPG